MTISFPNNFQLDLPLSTIVPSLEDEVKFRHWLTRLYEDVAATVNQKDWTTYTIAVGTTATPIPNIPNLGSYIICVSGTLEGMPACTYAMVKIRSNSAGSVSAILSVNGVTVGNNTTWNGVTLTIASSATNFTIVHNAAAGTIGNFIIRFIGTM